jgi:hypothetical protein
MSNLNERSGGDIAERKDFLLPETMGDGFDSSDLSEDMEGLDISFPRVKIPGGGVLQFELPSDDPERPSYAGELEGVILYNHSSNAYWPEGSEYSDDMPPMCQSLDGKTGHGDPGGLCESCGFNFFGSAANGKGKACKNMRMLYLLRSGDFLPLQISLPPTSIGPFRTFMNMVFMLRNRPTYGSIVKIGLKRANSNGYDYSVATFSKVCDLTGEELTAMQAYAANFREQIKRMLAEQAAVKESASNTIEMASTPLELPENGGHFSIEVFDGERKELPA